MKIFNIALLSVAALFGLAAATSADAYGGGRGGHGGHHHSGARVGVWFGAPVFPYYSPYYYPRYYYPPAYYPGYPAVGAPPVYIEQSTAPGATAPAAPSAQNSGAYWHYCADSKTYYPYVQQCASPWQQVVPQSTPPG